MRRAVAVLDDDDYAARRLADWSEVDKVADLTILPGPLAPERLSEILAPFDIMCLTRERTAVPCSLIHSLPRLRVIITTGQRTANLDVDAALGAGNRHQRTSCRMTSLPRTGWPDSSSACCYPWLERSTQAADPSPPDGGSNHRMGASGTVIGASRIRSCRQRHGPHRARVRHGCPWPGVRIWTGHGLPPLASACCQGTNCSRRSTCSARICPPLLIRSAASVVPNARS